MQEERQKDPSDTPSTQPDQIMDERGTVAAGSPDTTAVDDADGPAETRGTRDMDADANLGEDNPNPIPGEPPSEPDSEPPANKPKPRSAFVKISELQETDMITSWLQAFFDHFHYYKKSGELHGNISIDTIIYLEGPKKGGLLDLDPPIKMPGSFNTRPRQRWIPELEYDANGEVELGGQWEECHDVPIDWYTNQPVEHSK